MEKRDVINLTTDEPMQEGMSIKELFHILKTRVHWIILAFILVVGGAFAYLHYVTPMYESEVTILVESLQKSTDFESMLLQQGSGKISTEVELTLSRNNIENALSKLDLSHYTTEEGLSYEREGAVGNVRGRTSVTAVKDTNIVKISVTDKIPTFARDFANALAESYNELLGGIARNTKSAQKEFIQSQIPVNEEQLRKAADALRIFREESNYIQLSDKSKLLSEKIAYFQLRREPLSLQLKEAELASELAYQTLLENSYTLLTFEEVSGDKEVQNLLAATRERIKELTLYQSIQQGLSESPERLYLLQSALDNLSKTVLDRITLLIDSRSLQRDPLLFITAQQLAQSYQQRALTTAEIEVLISIEDSFTGELGGLPLLERQLLDLEREVQVYERLRLRLMELLEEVKIAEAAVARSVTVVDPAIVTLNRSGAAVPVSPKKMLIMAVALLLGLALGILLALFIEMLDVTIKEEGVLRRLAGVNRPLLGWVPLMNFNQNLPIPSLIVYNDPLSFESERYKLIANNLSFGSLHSQQRIFSITSPGMGEGKTTLSANIATSLAMNGLKVLLVDGDLRLPQLMNFFGLKQQGRGIVDVVNQEVGVQEVIVQPLADVNTLHLLPVGKIPPLPSAVFNSPSYVELLESLLGLYDYIIIDTPPLIFASELMAIARHVDGIAINVRAGVSTKGGLRELIDNLDLGSVNIVGLIFNGVIESKMGGHYSSGRYYTYQGSKYSRRYYSSHYNSSSKGATTNKVRKSYRRNFLKDLKRREKGRTADGKKPLFPFIEKEGAFEVDERQKESPPSIQPHRVEKKESGSDDWLSLIEEDPRAKGSRHQK